MTSTLHEPWTFAASGEVRILGEQQAGILSRRQLYALGITRGFVRAQVRARRWRRVGSQCLAMHTGPLPMLARWWAAVFEAGPRAMLDGVSALQASGLEHVDSDSIRVSVPRGARVRRGRGLNIRQTRRFRADDVAPSGIPRTRPAVAAVRAALWARSEREAALMLTATVQQGLASADQVAHEVLRIRRDRRRELVHALALDLIGGVRSLGELDVARACRDRGLPEPSRQVVRRTKSGTYYLDLIWDSYRLVVEVDGVQHTWAREVIPDALRHNAVTLSNATVLRLPLLGLRVDPDSFFEQIEEALVAAGCPPPPRVGIPARDVIRAGRDENLIA